jgi:hypothetical protein
MILICVSTCVCCTRMVWMIVCAGVDCLARSSVVRIVSTIADRKVVIVYRRRHPCHLQYHTIPVVVRSLLGCSRSIKNGENNQ